MNTSLRPFLGKMQPDVVALQVAPNRAQRYLAAEGYETYKFAKSIGEFTLLSRYPITDASFVKTEFDKTDRNPPAARFRIDFGGTPVSIYSVHVRSPRDTLRYYLRGAALYGVLGLPGTPWGEKRRENQVFWDKRIAQVEQMLDQIHADPLPCLVMGDFNAPAGGFIYSLVTDGLVDSHQMVGSGFGFSFPGVTRNPLSRGGPWMRIDYVLSDQKNWEHVTSVTEQGRRSQHRAVGARLELRPEAQTGPP